MERPEQKNDIVNAPIWGDGSRVEKGERIAPADTNISLALLMMMSAIQKKVSQKSCCSGHRRRPRPCQKAPPPSPHLQVPYNVWFPVQPAPPPGEHRRECDKGSIDFPLSPESLAFPPPSQFSSPFPFPNRKEEGKGHSCHSFPEPLFAGFFLVGRGREGGAETNLSLALRK